MLTVPPAPLTWTGNVPRHRQHDDHYFCDEDGLAESRYIFLQCNGLPQRWTDRQRFVIGEVGFGTGLNFLATVDLWLRTRTPGAVLHYFSLDQFVVSPAEVWRTLAPWPELHALAEHWLAEFPQPVPGFHRRELWQGSVILTLAYGEAATVLRQATAGVDAWFLDGFAPSRNPDIWREEVVRQIAALSRTGTTLASFTVAGMVRRALQAQGFRLEKAAGHGRKREILTGVMATTPPPPDHPPWFQPLSAFESDTRPVVVLGGGVAGMAVAWELAMRGRQIQLIEAGDQLAGGASGNAAGLVYPHLARSADLPTRFYLAAFLLSVQRLSRLAQRQAACGWHPTGVLQLLAEDGLRDRLRLQLPATLLQRVDSGRSAGLAGVDLRDDGLLHTLGGWLHPAAWCQALLQDQAPRIQVRYGARVRELEHDTRGWRVVFATGESLECDTLVIANGVDAANFTPLKYTTLTASRGQVSYLPGDMLASPLRLPLTGQGYLSPAGAAGYCAGASYHQHDHATELRQADHDFNLQQANSMLAVSLPSPYGGRAALRATTLDHLPLAGPVPDWQAWHSAYRDLYHGRPVGHYPAAGYQRGLYVSLGHGSRGLVTAMAAAAVIADSMDGTPHALEWDIITALHPGRFLLRAARRGDLLQSSP